MTGYLVNYVPGGSAVAMMKPFPPFGFAPRTWSEWWNGEPQPPPVLDSGIAVAYKNNSAVFKNLEKAQNLPTTHARRAASLTIPELSVSR